MAIQDSLISWWSMDEESGARVDSHGSNDLADNNTVLYGTGKQSNAADFEKDNGEWLNATDHATISFVDEDFSLALWVKLETDINSEIVTKFDAGDDYEYGFDVAGGVFRFKVTDGGGNSGQVTGLNPVAGTWYHIVCYHDSANNLLGLIVNDGVPDTAAYSDGSYDGAADLLVGRRADGVYYDGLIDELAMWGKVLASGEITELYNGGDGRAYGYWSFIPTATTIF